MLAVEPAPDVLLDVHRQSRVTHIRQRSQLAGTENLRDVMADITGVLGSALESNHGLKSLGEWGEWRGVLLGSTSGVNPESFYVSLNVDVDGMAAGTNLATKFREQSQGVWVYELKTALASNAVIMMTARIADQQGNITTMERRFTVAK
jgi:hypothetical protein